MDWRAKIKTLLEGKNASELARSVGLNPSAIGGAVSQGNIPRANKAVKIARALGVSTDWLFDDTQGWPPPQERSRTDLSGLDVSVVVEEVLRRKRAVKEAFDRLLHRYRELRAFHQQMFGRSNYSVEMVDLEKGEVRRLWDTLYDSAVAYSKVIESWSDYSKAWYEIDIFGDPNDEDIDEMIVVLKMFWPGQDRDQAAEAVRKLLQQWGMPPKEAKEAEAKPSRKRATGSRRKGKVIGSPQKRKSKAKGKKGRKR